MDKVNISKRMKQVASKVTPGFSIADIGCDHAYVSIYLVKKNISKKIVAMDINEGPVKRAKENIALYNCENYIDVRLSDGAKMLSPYEVDALLIAGMGGRLTVKILRDSLLTVLSCKELILQPQSDIKNVRNYLRHIGFEITGEEMIIDGNKYYNIIKAKNCYDINAAEERIKTIGEFYDYADNCIRTENEKEEETLVYDMFGKILLLNKDEILYKFLSHELFSKTQVIKQIDEEMLSNTDRLEILKERKKDINQWIYYIRKGLEFYEE
ncbi:MAG: class I SAM-dependent methyltransferase [Lachnospiraceae bacterium]|nr:class I SAM-dependent methyltransferase [Lachnospiraceae bacterium]